MKIKNTFELWVFNTTKLDIRVSDLNVKVPANKAVNVYVYNPYLTEAIVKKSMESGSLKNRLLSGALKVITKKPKETLPQKTKQANVFNARKTRSSIIIEPDIGDDEQEKFEFADYGVSDTISYHKVDNTVLADVKEEKHSLVEEKKVVEVKSVLGSAIVSSENITNAVEEIKMVGFAPESKEVVLVDDSKDYSSEVVLKEGSFVTEEVENKKVEAKSIEMQVDDSQVVSDVPVEQESQVKTKKRGRKAKQ